VRNVPQKKQREVVKIKMDDPRVPAIRLWVRAIATLEMMIKDHRAVLMARKGNRSDFMATLLLLEHSTLPVYFGLEIEGRLFEQYEAVEPIISWHYFE